MEQTPTLIIAGILSMEFLEGWSGVILTGLLIILTAIKIIKEIRGWKKND